MRRWICLMLLAGCSAAPTAVSKTTMTSSRPSTSIELPLHLVPPAALPSTSTSVRLTGGLPGDPAPARASASTPALTIGGEGVGRSEVDWDCIARAETGSDWQMHGSSYSSALGVMNEAVRENAPPDAAARILAGTASRDEQIAMAQRIVDRFGIRAWAPSTVAKCAA